MARRAPRTRFTGEIDQVIRAHLQTASGRSRRGEVRRAVAAAAAELGLPPGAVLKRWYRLRGQAAPLPPPRTSSRAAPPAAPRATETQPPGPAELLAGYQRALIRTAACRAELARAERDLLAAATRLAGLGGAEV